MPLQWAGLSPELLLSVDRESGEQLRAQLERQLRDAIRTGRLGAGERLPSSRELAREMGLSRGLVQDCYAQLQSEGYLVTHVGSATRVAAGAHVPPAPAPNRSAPERLIADFRHGVPDLTGFPLSDWLWALREAGRTLPTADLDYGDPRGSCALREVVAGYLRRVRAAAADPERIVICSGYAQGLGLTLESLAGAGVRVVAYEDPGAPATVTAAAAAAGLTAVPVPVDEQGIDVRALEATGARAVVVTPAHQWPTGVVLAPERRLALIEWATRRDAYVVEDDYDAEFRYDREPVGALHGLAADRVVSIGTVSKSLAPALRIGWLLCPPALAAPITATKLRTDRGSPTLDQLALARLVESGRYDRHLRHMRTTYAARRTALITALAAHAPEVRLTGLAAGFHAVAHLPGTDAAAERAVIDGARARSVGLYGMSACRSNRATAPPQLVLGFGDVGERAITEGIATIGDLLAGACRPGRAVAGQDLS
ncbi:MocR-like pyridoxine biosynthesis transcription factor PdxR [Streptomyces mirabilis]|jgi:GntR family transcriptional regulator/MocR family aminotransferase|uniref:GntR family transcriptional regulator / MocR family aminotransferase n=1 Tax=Streptomyces mirabilis TaxID=68239 RepID=A0A1I2QNJ7_9ACTN|nr:PLP-dependent aminotransferase family protein [Streptomyces mirabilis]SFG29550.1 GntR family transcriptional regulator / MocR family aminotransferase [Streptomyces mirabilis]